MKIAAFVLACAVQTHAASAGDWHPDSDRRYSLSVDGECRDVADADRGWRESLVANLRNRGGRVRSSEVAPRCASARILINGKASDSHRVFRKADSRRYLVLSQPDHRSDSYLVDFEQKYVLQIGGIHTTSIHPHPSLDFVVIVYTHSPVVYGIGIYDAADEENPRVEESEASWY